jgi:hypothetical protein
LKLPVGSRAHEAWGRFCAPPENAWGELGLGRVQGYYRVAITVELEDKAQILDMLESQAPSTQGNGCRLGVSSDRRLLTIDHQAHLQLLEPLVAGKDRQPKAG